MSSDHDAQAPPGTSLGASSLPGQPTGLDYAALFDASPGPCLILDRSLNIVGANAAYLAITGRTLAEIAGREAWDAFPTDPGTLRQLIASFRRVLHTRKPDTLALLRFDVPKADAGPGEIERRYWSIVHSPVLDASGEVVLLLQYPSDVTELKRLRDTGGAGAGDLRQGPAQGGAFSRLRSVHEENRELQAESDRLRELFEQAPGFMCVLRGREHCFELTNRRYEQMMGQRDLIGRSCREAVPELEGQGFFELLDRVYATGQTFVGKDMKIFLEGANGEAGSRRFLDFVYQPITDRTGSVSGIFVEGTDVTEAKEAADALRELNETLEARVEDRTVALRHAEEQLRQSQKMEAVGQLTGGLAHDFNNLLTGISGNLELLRSRIGQGAVTQTANVGRYIDAALDAAGRAAALTHRLLAFSRRQTLAPRATDVNRLVAGMTDLVRRTVGPEIAVEMVAPDGLWNTLVDPGQLENALLNLCLNARDAMPDGGRLTVETGNRGLDQAAAMTYDLAAGQYVVLRVADDGTGMAPEVIERAFDPFFTTKPIGQGTGLGLSMIYGFARQSGGQVRIESAPGRGTSVSLYLPRHLGMAEPVETPAGPADAPRGGNGRTVLVVDDEPTVRMLVTEVLEDLGYTAIEAADGAGGLAVLTSGVRIDLLVSDVGLPGGLNGRQMADAGRVLRPGLKVLFITGYAQNATLDHDALDPGMHVLTKPFGLQVLARRITELIV